MVMSLGQSQFEIGNFQYKICGETGGVELEKCGHLGSKESLMEKRRPSLLVSLMEPYFRKICLRVQHFFFFFIPFELCNNVFKFKGTFFQS